MWEDLTPLLAGIVPVAMARATVKAAAAQVGL